MWAATLLVYMVRFGLWGSGAYIVITELQEPYSPISISVYALGGGLFLAGLAWGQLQVGLYKVFGVLALLVGVMGTLFGIFTNSRGEELELILMGAGGLVFGAMLYGSAVILTRRGGFIDEASLLLDGLPVIRNWKELNTHFLKYVTLYHLDPSRCLLVTEDFEQELQLERRDGFEYDHHAMMLTLKVEDEIRRQMRVGWYWVVVGVVVTSISAIVASSAGEFTLFIGPAIYGLIGVAQAANKLKAVRKVSFTLPVAAIDLAKVLQEYEARKGEPAPQLT